MRALVVQLALLITTQTRVTLALSALLSSPYKHFNLERLCGPVKNKQSLYLHNQAHQFTFNATNKELIKCHLELHLHSDIFGFSVFIQEMKLGDSEDCSRDFLQFGRCVYLNSNNRRGDVSYLTFSETSLCSHHTRAKSDAVFSRLSTCQGRSWGRIG